MWSDSKGKRLNKLNKAEFAQQFLKDYMDTFINEVEGAAGFQQFKERIRNVWTKALNVEEQSTDNNNKEEMTQINRMEKGEDENTKN